METAQSGQDAPSPQLNDELYREIRMLVLRGLTPEQLRSHYHLNGAPEAFVTLVFETATGLINEQASVANGRRFWGLFDRS